MIVDVRTDLLSAKTSFSIKIPVALDLADPDVCAMVKFNPVVPFFDRSMTNLADDAIMLLDIEIPPESVLVDRGNEP